MNGKEGKSGRKKRHNRGRKSKKKSKTRGSGNVTQQRPMCNYDSDSEDEYMNRDRLDNDAKVQRHGVEFGAFRQDADDDAYTRLRSSGFDGDHRQDNRFTSEVSGFRSRALTSMVESQMEKARINILEKGVSAERHLLDFATKRFLNTQKDKLSDGSIDRLRDRSREISEERWRDRSRDRFRDRSRDRSPLDSSWRHQNEETARDFRRQELESNFARMRPEYDFEIQQERIQEDKHERSLFNSRRPLVESPFQQDLSDESDQSFEQDYDDGSYQTSEEDIIEIPHTAFEQDIVETDPRYELTLHGNHQETDSSDDEMITVRDNAMAQNLRRIEQMQSVSFGGSNLGGLQQTITKSNFIPNVASDLQLTKIHTSNIGELPMMQSFGGSNFVGLQQTITKSNFTPNVASNLQIPKIPTSNIGGLPMMQSYGGIQHDTQVGVLPVSSSIPIAASMTQMPNLMTVPQMSDVSGVQSMPGLEAISQRPNVFGNMSIPGMVGNFQTPAIGGIPPRPYIASNLNSPGGISLLSNTGHNNFGGHLVSSTFRNPVPPSNIAMPPNVSNSGFAQNLINSGFAQNHVNTGIPPSLYNTGISPTAYNIVNPENTSRLKKPALLPNPDVSGLHRRPSNPGNNYPRPYVNKKTKGNLVNIKFKTSSTCPVCPCSKLFGDEIQFQDHWRTFHIKNNELHYCPSQGCQCVTNSALKLQEHFLDNHNGESKELSVNSLQKLCLAKKKMVNNLLFKDPHPFVYGEKEKERESFVFTSKSKCPVCKNSPIFDNLEAFSGHWQNIHTKLAKKFCCPNTDCKTLVPSLEELKKHYLDKHNYGNDELTKATIESLEPKWKVIVNDKYKDPGKSVLSSFKPLEIEFEPNMTCLICKNSERLKSLEEYQCHWQKYHVEHCEVLLCPIDDCKLPAASQDQLRHHYDRYHKHHKLPYENRMASTLLANARKEMRLNKIYKDPGNCIFSTLEENLTITEFDFEEGMTCPVCQDSTTYETENEFSIHWITHTRYIRKYPCPFSKCKTKERSISNLNLHISKDHGILEKWNVDMFGSLKPVKSENEMYIDPGSHRYVKDYTKSYIF